jgi:hypothetical protein
MLDTNIRNRHLNGVEPRGDSGNLFVAARTWSHRFIKCSGSDLDRMRNAIHVWIVTRHKRTGIAGKYHIRLLFAIAVQI